MSYIKHIFKQLFIQCRGVYDEQYVKKSKITPRQEKLWSEEEKQELTQEKTEQKEQPESIINEGESDEDRKEL